MWFFVPWFYNNIINSAWQINQISDSVLLESLCPNLLNLKISDIKIWRFCFLEASHHITMISSMLIISCNWRSTFRLSHSPNLMKITSVKVEWNNFSKSCEQRMMMPPPTMNVVWNWINVSKTSCCSNLVNTSISLMELKSFNVLR